MASLRLGGGADRRWQARRRGSPGRDS